MSYSHHPPASLPKAVAAAKTTLRMARSATLSHPALRPRRIAVAHSLAGHPLAVLDGRDAAGLAAAPDCTLAFEGGLTLTCSAAAAPSAEALARYAAHQGAAEGPLFQFRIVGALAGSEPLDVGALSAGDESFATMERRAVDHMNDDHLDAIAHYAQDLLGAAPGDWRMTTLDLEGLDLSSGAQSLRLWFDPPLAGPGEVKARLVDLARLKLG